MEEQMETIITCDQLVKKYEDFVAVDHLSLEIKKGEIFGLLGPNGAGKTTTILMMMGLSEPTEGTVIINGFNATKEPIKIKRQVGYLQDNVGFYEDLSPLENLQLIARLNGIKKTSETFFDDILQRVGLLDVKDKPVGEFSRGMRQRLGFGDLLVKDPEIVILDEPTLGLDPEGIDEILQLIKDLSVIDKRTIIISSHLLYQMQRLCDRVGIFVKGKLLSVGPIDTLAKDVFGESHFKYILQFDQSSEQVMPWLEALEGIDHIEIENADIMVYCTKDIRKELMSACFEHEATLFKLQPATGNLEDIYRMFFKNDAEKKEEVKKRHAALQRIKRTN